MKNWVFDLDGTLVDSFGRYFDLLRKIFADHGRDFDDSLRHPALTEKLDVFFSRYLGQEQVERVLQRLQAESNEDARRIEVFPGLLGLVDNLRGRGSRVAIWTNRDFESASLIIKYSGLENRIDGWVSGTCVSERKPNAEGLRRLISDFGCSPEDVTMVGDHEHDMLGALEVGARAVRASWHSHWDEQQCGHAHHQFHQVDEFIRFAGRTL